MATVARRSRSRYLPFSPTDAAEVLDPVTRYHPALAVPHHGDLGRPGVGKHVVHEYVEFVGRVYDVVQALVAVVQGEDAVSPVPLLEERVRPSSVHGLERAVHEDYGVRPIGGRRTGNVAPGGGVASWGGDEESDPLLDPVGFFHSFGDLLGNVKLFYIFSDHLVE